MAYGWQHYAWACPHSCKMPPRKKAKRKKELCQDTPPPPASMLSLPPEILVRVLSLSGPGPARLAQTCKAWRAVLEEPNPDLYSHVKLFHPTPEQSVTAARVGPPSCGGHLPRWLQQRRGAIQTLTVHNFKVRDDSCGSQL